MAIATTPEPRPDKYAGLSVGLPGVGKLTLSHLLHQNSETSIYASSHPGMVLKTFNLECGKSDEVSYGPYLSFRVEVENWEDIQGIPELRVQVPAYYGSHMDSERKFAYIAMEYLEGQNLLAWCQEAAEFGYPEEWAADFRSALYETLAIVGLFHKYGIILIDFKPDNVIRLANGIVKFVDLGAFFTPRHRLETEKYVYAATPDYAELVIDTSNVQTGLPLKQGADIFSAGVALFEMATGGSRLSMAPDCAESMLKLPAIYLFRDSQIKDIWREYPHLEDLLPLVQTQLKERKILFAEFWHLLKGYLATQVPDWENMTEDQHREMLLATGTSFISDQLPDALKWLADPIAQATTLRSFRITSIEQLMQQLGAPVADNVREDILQHNPVIQMGRDLDPPVQFRDPLNVWEVRLNPGTNHWAISTRTAAWELRQVSAFAFVKEVHRDEMGHRFFQIVGDLEADVVDGERLTLERLGQDRTAWLAG